MNTSPLTLNPNGFTGFCHSVSARPQKMRRRAFLWLRAPGERPPIALKASPSTTIEGTATVHGGLVSLRAGDIFKWLRRRAKQQPNCLHELRRSSGYVRRAATKPALPQNRTQRHMDFIAAFIGFLCFVMGLAVGVVLML